MNNPQMGTRGSGFKSRKVDELLASISSLWVDGKALLVVGERGTGKDYAVSRLAAMWGITNIKRVDCGGQDTNSLRQALLGYFDYYIAETSYDRDEAIVPGAIEEASEGILYLDRIDHAPHDSIDTLAAALDNQPFMRVNDTQLTYPNNVKVIASCRPHPYLSILTAHLHSRLQTAFGNRIVALSTLADRPDEIIPALEWFLYEEGYSSGLAGQTQLEPTWQEILTRHTWTSGFHDVKRLARRLIRDLKQNTRLETNYLQTCLHELAQSRAESTENALRARCVSHANTLLYHGTTLDPMKLFDWIQQFTPYASSDSVDPRYYAEELILQIKSRYFYGNQRLKRILVDQWQKLDQLIRTDPELCKRFGDSLNDSLQDVIVTSPLGPMKSPSLMQHLLRECGLLSHRNGCEFDKLVAKLQNSSKPVIVLFIDDFAGTGKQFRRSVVDSLKNDTSMQEALAGHPDTLFVAIICVAYESSVVRINQGLTDAPEWIRSRFHLLVGDLLNEQDQAFHPASCIFPEETARNTALDIIVKTVGKRLYPDGPDGMGHIQSLVVFEHNTPNNSLPVLWKESSNAFSWQPIFPRNR